MPITNTLETSRRLTQAGIPAAQAEVFSELFESTAQDALRELKAVVAQEGERTRAELRAELQTLRVEMQSLRVEMHTLRADLRAEFREELRKQMFWFFTMLVALFGVAIAVLKFLPQMP